MFVVKNLFLIIFTCLEFYCGCAFQRTIIFDAKYVTSTENLS